MKEELNKYIKYIFTWNNPLFFAILIAVIILMFAYIVYYHILLPNKKQYIKEKMEAELNASKLITEKYKTFALQLQEKLEMEKQRLGRELHDSIGQNLLLMRMKLNNSEEHPNEVVKVIDSTLKDLKEIIFDLRPRALEELGLPAAIINLCEQIKRNLGITGEVNVSGTVKKLNSEKELYLYRIVQECINNIIKHSGAREFNVQLIYNEINLKIMTIDEGKGMDVEAAKNGKGNGLFNIEERLKHLGGSLNINSSPDEGTVLLMEVPYDG